MLVNPWGLWWQELTASDICQVDADAHVVRGRWDVTPAIHIHTELHRVRDDARVVIHNHPSRAADLAARIGGANLTVLASHGVIVTGGNLPEAVYRAASVDRVCRLAYDVMLTGGQSSQMNWSDMVGMRASLIERAADVCWAGAARMTIKADPDVLT